MLRITVEDLDGVQPSETREIPEGEYVVICHEPCHISSTSVWPTKGTVQLTIKDWRPRA